MKAYQGTTVPSTVSCTVLGFTLTKYTDRCLTGQTHWAVSRPGDFCIILPTLSEALGLIWEVRTAGGAA